MRSSGTTTRNLLLKTHTVVLGIALAAASLGGCTIYHAAGPSGGFSDTKLSATRYQVPFRGNGHTSPGRAEKFVLRRAAELALENGYRYFVMDAPQNLTGVISGANIRREASRFASSNPAHPNRPMR